MIASTGNVSVASNVLLDLVQTALREVTGIVRFGQTPKHDLLGAHTGAGLLVQSDSLGVAVSCCVIAAADINLLELGLTIQATVAAVVQELAGMVVREVNVTIQDVEIHRD